MIAIRLSAMTWDAMLLSDAFERFVKKSPISVMARAAMEHALSNEALDELFEQQADQQYTRELLFSSVVGLMGVVVSKSQPSIHAAFQAVAETLPVSITALYNKLNGVEPKVTGALVSHTAARLSPVVVATGGQLPAVVPNYRVRIIDGTAPLHASAVLSPRRKFPSWSPAPNLPGRELLRRGRLGALQRRRRRNRTPKIVEDRDVRR